MQNLNPKPNIVYLPTISQKTPEIHLLGRESRKLISTLLKYENDEPLFLIGKKINSMNFYDQTISSQVMLDNKLWNKAHASYLTGILTKWCGISIPEKEQTILSIRNNVLQEILDSKLREFISIDENAKISKFEYDSQEKFAFHIKLADNTIIKPKFVFTSDLNSEFAKQLGLEYKSIFYKQKIASCYCALTEDLQEMYIRTLSDGFIQLIPLESKQAYLQFCYNDDNSGLEKLSKSQYLEMINKKLQTISTQNTHKFFNTPLSYPPIIVDQISDLKTRETTWKHPNTFHSKNVFLLGNAAHEFYPYLLHDSNIMLSETNEFYKDLEQTGSISKVTESKLMTTAMTYGNTQHLLKEITQTENVIGKTLHTIGAGLLNCPLTAYLVNEMAHAVNMNCNPLEKYIKKIIP